jgi:hypothetical protein
MLSRDFTMVDSALKQGMTIEIIGFSADSGDEYD